MKNPKTIVFFLATVICTTASAQAQRICPQLPPGAVPIGRYCKDAPERIPAPIESVSSVTQDGAANAQTSSTVAQVQAPAQVAPPEQVKTALVIRAGERLMPILKKWLADQNIELIWAANAATSGRVRDVVFEDDFESSSTDIAPSLTEALMPFGLEAEITAGTSIRRVTVRNVRNNL